MPMDIVIKGETPQGDTAIEAMETWLGSEMHHEIKINDLDVVSISIDVNVVAHWLTSMRDQFSRMNSLFEARQSRKLILWERVCFGI